MIKHIIWDWNGTLLDDVGLSLEAINIVLARYNLPPLRKERYLEIFTFPVIEYYRELGFNFDRTPFEQVGTEFISEYTARMLKVPLNRGARNFIKQAHQADVGQSLLSAAKVQMLETMMEHHNLDQYFQRIIGLDNHYAHSKLAAGLAWRRQLSLADDDILYVGDTLHDVDVAGEIGVPIVLLSLGHTSADRLIATGNRVFRDFAQLSRWFHARSV